MATQAIGDHIACSKRVMVMIEAETSIPFNEKNEWKWPKTAQNR